MSGAFDTLVRHPWHRAAVGLLLSADTVPVRSLLPLVVVKGSSRSRPHYLQADRERAVSSLLAQLGEHGAVEVRTCFPGRLGCPCALVVIRERIVLERIARLQAVGRASNPPRRYPAPKPEPEQGGGLRLIHGGGAA